jgi:hypothetical protein
MSVECLDSGEQLVVVAAVDEHLRKRKKDEKGNYDHPYNFNANTCEFCLTLCISTERGPFSNSACSSLSSTVSLLGNKMGCNN